MRAFNPVKDGTFQLSLDNGQTWEFIGNISSIDVADIYQPSCGGTADILDFATSTEIRFTTTLETCENWWDRFADADNDADTTWTCPSCGKVNRHDQLACGAGEWDGCGGARPG